MFEWKKRLGQQDPQPVCLVLHRLKQTMPDRWLPQIVCLTTPFAATMALHQCGLPQAMIEFITAYEPRAAQQGIFVHQQQVLQTSLQHSKHILLTSSTGSGKSLCFWAWIAHKLVQNPQATALVCFPTQALLWGQSVRLQEISRDCVISSHGLAYSGQFAVAGQTIAWTVWKGSGSSDQAMAAHEQSRAFKQARLRIATIDKVHYSLLRCDAEFVARLSCIVLDEAHQYQGLFGAQAAYLLKRLSVFKTALGKPSPQVFLASATLPQAKEFAAKLLSVSPGEIVHHRDAIQTLVELVDWAEAEEKLTHPPQSGLLRVALFYDKQPTRPPVASLLGAGSLGRCRVVYFSPSKRSSRLLKQNLISRGRGPHVIIYDADLPLAERRALEKKFRLLPNSPITLLATNALELGVDIGGLDVCFIPEVPTSPADLLQRMGRVGRRQGRPGLIVVNLSTSLRDEQYRRNLAGLFRLPKDQEVFLPVQLEWVKLKSIAALDQEFRQAQTKFPSLSTVACRQAVEFAYGECPAASEIKRRLTDICGTIDFTRAYWQYAGFRGGGNGQDKVPLIDQATKQILALLDRTAVLRDAPMGANYLDHNNNNWKVVSYGSKLDGVLDQQRKCGIDVNQIQRIYVKAAAAGVVTRGICRNVAKLTSTIVICCRIPKNLVYGQWRVRQTVATYRKVQTVERQVTIEKIPSSEILFKDVVTLGWVWQLPLELTNEAELCLREMSDFFQWVFAGLVMQTAGVAPQDLFVDFSARRRELQIMDAEQGGNGVAAYLLRGGTEQALRQCCQVLIDYREGCYTKSDLVVQAVAPIHNLNQAIAIMQILCRQWLLPE
jgi:superfamily II DNA/RNA helicase